MIDGAKKLSANMAIFLHVRIDIIQVFWEDVSTEPFIFIQSALELDPKIKFPTLLSQYNSGYVLSQFGSQ